MTDTSMVQEHMPVVGSDGGHVGTVDHLDGQRIKLTRTDPEAQGQHHFIHVDSIAAIEGGEVRLNRTTAEAEDEWGDRRIAALPTGWAGVHYLSRPAGLGRPSPRPAAARTIAMRGKFKVYLCGTEI